MSSHATAAAASQQLRPATTGVKGSQLRHSSSQAGQVKRHFSVSRLTSAQKHPSHFSYSSQQQQPLPHYNSVQVQLSQPKKRVYKVFGVSSQKILDKRAVQTRPMTTVDDFDLDKDVTDRDATTRITTSASALKKPPVVRPRLSVVNARSAAAKLVLRHLCR